MDDDDSNPRDPALGCWVILGAAFATLLLMVAFGFAVGWMFNRV